MNSLQTRLLRTANLNLDETTKAPVASLQHQLSCQDIPLNRSRSGIQLQYVSALAFKLSQQPTPLMLAQQIAANLNQLIKLDKPNGILGKVWQNFTISAIPPGWIYLSLTDPGVAKWLQDLSQLPLNRFKPKSVQNSQPFTDFDFNPVPVFTALQIHARCCALLRMAVREDLIRSETLEIQTSTTSLSSAIENLESGAQVFPWLDSQQCLRCRQPQEWQLILQICDAIDYLDQATLTEDKQQTLKIALKLSQAFQAFDAACRIWGEVKIRDRSLAQVRLGLVLITQKTLRALLEQLNLPAPIEL